MNQFNQPQNPINAIQAAPITSSKYKFIRSEAMLYAFINQGFNLISSSIAYTRVPERKGYQRHCLTFTRPEWCFFDKDRIQLTIVNSHDGKGSFRLILGYYRQVCANGLMASRVKFEIRITHMGDINEKIKEAIGKLLILANQLASKVDLMKGRILTSREIEDLENRAVFLRTKKEVDRVWSVPIRREGDGSSDLWTVFNRLQEGLIRGGIEYQGFTGELKTLRKISSIKSTVDVNQKLWEIAETYLQAA